jgi:hypothetical protein
MKDIFAIEGSLMSFSSLKGHQHFKERISFVRMWQKGGFFCPPFTGSHLS